MNTPSLSSKRFGSHWATKQFEQDHGDGLTSLGDTAAFDYWHCDSSARLELKASRPTSTGSYTFQYIHPDRFDVAVFLGYRFDAPPLYWVIAADALPCFLSIQHRDQASYQLRVSSRAAAALAPFQVTPESLAAALSLACSRAVRTRRRVFLVPTFLALDGWPEIATRLERGLKQGFDTRWQIRILVAPADEQDLLPYPRFISAEFRMDYYAHPHGVVGLSDIRGTAASILDFLLAHEFPDIDECA